jgi:hypothetical protein
MNEVSSQDLSLLNKMSPEERLDYTLSVMIQSQSLWGLNGKDGWVMLKADDDTCMPIWPHKECAVAWIKDQFPECEAKPIDFVEWLDLWLPGMSKNNSLILVFPSGEEVEGMILSAQEMQECFEVDLNDLTGDGAQ